MLCLHPINIKNPKTGKYMLVPCGRCPNCLKRRQNEWSIRIQMEAKYTSTPPLFVTFTYDDEHLPFGFNTDTGECVPVLKKRDLQLFFKRYRKRLGYPIRYFACGEYGENTERPHFHAVLFGVKDDDIKKIQNVIEKCWTYGFTSLESFTVAHSKYVAKYSCKQFIDEYKGLPKPFALMSRRPAIGSKMLSDNKIKSDLIKNKKFVLYDVNGSPYVLPRYYRNKLFCERTLKKRADLYSSMALDRLYSDYAKFGAEKVSFLDRLSSENTERLFYYRLNKKNEK